MVKRDDEFMISQHQAGQTMCGEAHRILTQTNPAARPGCSGRLTAHDRREQPNLIAIVQRRIKFAGFIVDEDIPD
jgi:hypothetical protein